MQGRVFSNEPTLLAELQDKIDNLEQNVRANRDLLYNLLAQKCESGRIENVGRIQQIIYESRRNDTDL
jgi:hypothetical protein